MVRHHTGFRQWAMSAAGFAPASQQWTPLQTRSQRLGMFHRLRPSLAGRGPRLAERRPRLVEARPRLVESTPQVGERGLSWAENAQGSFDIDPASVEDDVDNSVDIRPTDFGQTRPSSGRAQPKFGRSRPDFSQAQLKCGCFRPQLGRAQPEFGQSQSRPDFAVEPNPNLEAPRCLKACLCCRALSRFLARPRIGRTQTKIRTERSTNQALCASFRPCPVA